MNDLILDFIKKQRQRFGEFAGLFLAAEKSLEQQEIDFLRYGIASPHIRKIEQAQATTIQWYHAFQQKLHRLYERLKKLAEADDQLFFAEQQSKLKKEEDDYWATVDAPKQNKKRPLTQNHFQRWLQKFIAMLALRIKKLNTLLYKVQRFHARVKEAKKAVFKKQVDPLLENIKQKAKSKKWTYQSTQPDSPPIELDEHIDLFMEHVSRDIHSGAMTPENMHAKLWGATYDDGTIEEGALPKALAQNEQTKSLPPKEKETIRENFIKEMEKIPEFLVQLPQAIYKATKVIGLEIFADRVVDCVSFQGGLLTDTKSKAESLSEEGVNEEAVPATLSSIFEQAQEVPHQQPEIPVLEFNFAGGTIFEKIESDLDSVDEITYELDDFLSNQLDDIQQNNDVPNASQLSATLLPAPKPASLTQTAEQKPTATPKIFHPKSS